MSEEAKSAPEASGAEPQAPEALEGAQAAGARKFVEEAIERES